MRIFTISLLILILSTCLLAQIPTDSLVAYYPFNGNPYDESGNGYNGVVNGALLTADRFEKPNSAYQFESTNTIDMGDILSSVFVSNIYSMSVWYKCTGQDGALISKWFSGCENTGNAFYMTPGAYCTNRGSNSSCDPYRCTNISVNGEQGRWIHQVVGRASFRSGIAGHHDTYQRHNLARLFQAD